MNLCEHAAHAAATIRLDRIDRHRRDGTVLLERRALRRLERVERLLRQRDDGAETAVELEQISGERVQLRIADLDDALAALPQHVEHSRARIAIPDRVRADEGEASADG